MPPKLAISKLPVKDKKIKDLEVYLRKIDQAYAKSQTGEKVPYLYPSFATVKAFAYANRLQRSAVPLFFCEEKDEGEFANLTKLLSELKNHVQAGSVFRAQIIFNSSTHYLAIDVKFSKDQQECFVLDAADMSGSALAQELTKCCTTVYLAYNEANNLFQKLQHDQISCAFYAMSQVNEMSHFDLFAFMHAFMIKQPGILQKIPFDCLPAQLLKNVQAGEQRLNSLCEKIKVRQAATPFPDEMPATELRAYYQKHLHAINGKKSNAALFEATYKPMVEHLGKLRSDLSNLCLLAVMDRMSIQPVEPAHQPLEKENVTNSYAS